MALTEHTEEDKLEVVSEFKIIQVRTATVIKKDGKEISRSFHRHAVAPNATAEEIAAQSADVKAMIAQFHTDEIKAAYAKHIAETAPADGE